MINRKQIENSIAIVAKEYPIKKVDLFGSYASDTYNQDSDIDLLVEFNTPSVSLLTISGLKHRLEEIIGISVDIIHAPISENALITIGEVVSLYES